MKLDCGPTVAEKRADREHWHLWFAWHPVRIGSHDCRWLEKVWRRYKRDYNTGRWELKFAEYNTGRPHTVRPGKLHLVTDRERTSYNLGWQDCQRGRGALRSNNDLAEKLGDVG